ncbi:MAG: SulP family inorganic anion transporter [Candidatus Melainabacteria bacterium]
MNNPTTATPSSLGETIRQRFFTNIPGEISGGLIAAIVALPLALAFGEASGMGAKAGLYGAIFCGLLAALFGGTPAQVTGPTGPMTVVAAEVVANHPSDPHLLFMAVALAGLFQIGFGMLRIGQWIYLIPYPVVSGFMSGIGVIIISLQLTPLMGVKGPGAVLEALEVAAETLMHPNIPATLIGLGTLAIIYLWPRINKTVPSALVALVALTALSQFLQLDITRIGTIPSGLPQLNMAGWFETGHLNLLITTGLTIAMLGSLDSLLTSLVADKVTGRAHDSNQELIGQGIGNAVAGVFGGLPGAGATMRTLVNIKANGKWYLSGVVHSLVLLAVLLGLSPLVEGIPQAVLAGILISVGIGIIDYNGIRMLPRAPKSDALVMLVVLGLTVFSDLILAVLVGTTLACLLFVNAMSRKPVFSEGFLSQRYPTLHGQYPQPLLESIYEYKFRGPLFFGQVKLIKDRLQQMPDEIGVIFNLIHVPMVDLSSMVALKEAIAQFESRNIHVYLMGAREHITPQVAGLAPRFSRLGEILDAIQSETEKPAGV